MNNHNILLLWSTIFYLSFNTAVQGEEPKSTVCDSKDKINIWFYPDRYNEDTAERAILNPNQLIEHGIVLNNKEQIKRNSQRVTHNIDLNNDLRNDIITSGYCGTNTCMYSIYINCGSDQFVHMEEFSPYPMEVQVINTNKSGWKDVKTLNEGAVSYPTPNYGSHVTYRFIDSAYTPIKKEVQPEPDCF